MRGSTGTAGPDRHRRRVMLDGPHAARGAPQHQADADHAHRHGTPEIDGQETSKPRIPSEPAVPAEGSGWFRVHRSCECEGFTGR